MATPVARGLPASRRTSQKKLFSYEPPDDAYCSQRQGAGVGFKARGNRSTLDNAEPFLLGAAATVGVSGEERDRAVAVS